MQSNEIRRLRREGALFMSVYKCVGCKQTIIRADLRNMKWCPFCKGRLTFRMRGPAWYPSSKEKK